VQTPPSDGSANEKGQADDADGASASKPARARTSRARSAVKTRAADSSPVHAEVNGNGGGKLTSRAMTTEPRLRPPRHSSTGAILQSREMSWMRSRTARPRFSRAQASPGAAASQLRQRLSTRFWRAARR